MSKQAQELAETYASLHYYKGSVDYKVAVAAHLDGHLAAQNRVEELEETLKKISKSIVRPVSMTDACCQLGLIEIVAVKALITSQEKETK